MLANFRRQKSELCPRVHFSFQGTLNLARRLGLSMPDMPHDEMVALLLDAWDCVVYKTGHTRKQMYRKVWNLNSNII